MGNGFVCFGRTLHSSGLTLKQARRYWSGCGFFYSIIPPGIGGLIFCKGRDGVLVKGGRGKNNKRTDLVSSAWSTFILMLSILSRLDVADTLAR